MSLARDRQQEVSALLLRRTEYGESDLVLQVLSDALGRISVMARAARASKRRFAGGLEPFHGLKLQLDAPRTGELYRLRETRLEQPRFNLVGNLAALEIAGRALAWVRDMTAPSSPEPAIFGACNQLLDNLDREPDVNRTQGTTMLAMFGLCLLDALGWGLELERCVRCERPCPPAAPSTLDPRHGGLVCRRCGGGRFLLSGKLRQQLLLAARHEAPELSVADASTLLEIVEAALHAHSGIEAR